MNLLHQLWCYLHHYLHKRIEINSEDVKRFFDTNVKCEVIDMISNPNDMCDLQDGNLLVANTTQKNLTLFDNNLNLIKITDKLKDVAFSPSRITCNEFDKIYIIDHSTYQVIMLDLNLNKIKYRNTPQYLTGTSWFCFSGRLTLGDFTFINFSHWKS